MTSDTHSVDRTQIRKGLTRVSAPDAAVPHASVVIPVNAQGDLENVLALLEDLAGYAGAHSFEVVLVVNHYPEAEPPEAIERYRELGAVVVAIPDTQRPGEAPGFSARMAGVRVARADAVLLFDADCRIPRPGAVIDWYVQQFEEGATAAYTHVDYYGYEDAASIRFSLAIHHTSRWIKRNLLGVPTTRGSNYAVRRGRLLELYDEGLLADEMNVGPTVRAKGGRVVYSGAKALVVLTSGRMLEPGFGKLVRYFGYRLRYNLRVLPVGPAANRTGREQDPERRYVDNRPVR